MPKRAALLVTLCVFATLPVAAPAEAQAPVADHVVQAGALHPDNPSAPYEYTRYYPDTIKVHRGQTVRWNAVGDGVATGFHTITFSSAGRPPFIRADEAPNAYGAPTAWFAGSDCGRNGLGPCVLQSRDQFVSSGIPPLGGSPFEVTVDLPPGTYEYFCTVHPAMAGAVEVVGDAEPVPTPEQTAAARAAAIAQDSAAADELFAQDQVPHSTIEDGQRVHRVLLGDSTDDNHVSLIAYLPTNLDVAAGDKVRFVYNDDIVNEVHTATFPSAVVGNFSPPHGTGGLGLSFGCDLDDVSGGLPGIPGPWGVVLPCPANLELLFAPWMTSVNAAPGNEVATPATYHDSGMLIPPLAPDGFRALPGGGELPDSFEAEFPNPGSFVYECNIHVDPMSGSIEVS